MKQRVYYRCCWFARHGLLMLSCALICLIGSAVSSRNALSLPSRARCISPWAECDRPDLQGSMHAGDTRDVFLEVAFALLLGRESVEAFAWEGVDPALDPLDLFPCEGGDVGSRYLPVLREREDSIICRPNQQTPKTPQVPHPQQTQSSHIRFSACPSHDW